MRGIRKTLFFALLLMFVHQVLAFFSAYYVFSVNVFWPYPLLYSFFCLGATVTFAALLLSKGSKYYEYFNIGFKFAIGEGVSVALIVIASIMFVNSIIFIGNNINESDIRDLALGSGQFGGNQFFATLAPLMPTLAIALMLSSAVLGNRKMIFFSALAVAFFEASTLSRSGFVTIILATVIYLFRTGSSVSRFLIFPFLVFTLASIVGIFQGRFELDNILIVLYAPINGFFRYSAESFAMPEAAYPVASGFPFEAVLFGWPIIKLQTYFGDPLATYFLYDFRTQFFPVELDGQAFMSNVVHSIPSLLYASGGISGFLVAFFIYLALFVAVFQINPVVAFVYYYYFFYRGAFAYDLLSWIPLFSLIIIAIILNSKAIVKAIAKFLVFRNA